MSERQSKNTQDKHERILNDVVKQPGNENCADCGAKSKFPFFIEMMNDLF